MANSWRWKFIMVRSVVNCFQISNFVLWQTAALTARNLDIVLWIAFKLVILSYGKQLFSKRYIFVIVVNCFQISNFVLWQTAFFVFILFGVLLWIAFKLVILSYGKQRLFIYYFVCSVVNCFQISNFVLWQTALFIVNMSCLVLWIAFKLVILSYGKQLFMISSIIYYCCELLSN